MAVVPNQPILGRQPHEALGVLQRYENRPLRQPLGGRKVLQNQRRGICCAGGTAGHEEPYDSEDHRGRAAAVVVVCAHPPRMHAARA